MARKKKVRKNNDLMYHSNFDIKIRYCHAKLLSYLYIVTNIIIIMLTAFILVALPYAAQLRYRNRSENKIDSITKSRCSTGFTSF